MPQVNLFGHNRAAEDCSYLENAINEIEDYAIILMDVYGDIVNWNRGAEKIKGYTADEIIGENFRRFYTVEDRQLKKPEELLKKAAETGRAQDEGWRMKKDGSLFWASVTISAIHDENKSLAGFSKVTRDLTERKANDAAKELYTEQLKAKNKELEQFVYIASHDLQEPLRSVTSLTEILEAEYGSLFDEKGVVMLGYITAATNRMKELIKGLLDYSRLGQNRQLAAIDCSKLLEEVQRDLEFSLTEHKAVITSTHLPALQGYKTELRLLFQNLLGNAIKFVKPGAAPAVHISCEERVDDFLFAVKDNGIGIAPEYREKIFVIFQRLNNRNAYAGNGIGLAHCNKIVQLHGGKIWVESEPGQGSTFYFTIHKF
ncbi:MAG TPA: ATP-binding protein [Chitinophagaceae bacterium]|nr:ATP-binding protein [Chitinophagaceae bacterium]